MDLQQTLNLGLMRELAAMGVKFCLPCPHRACGPDACRASPPPARGPFAGLMG